MDNKDKMNGENMMITPEELYRRYLKGDDTAFDRLLELFREGVTLFILRTVKDMTVAEDIAIDVFADLVIHKHRFDPKRASLKTYLYLMARSRTVDYLRKAAKTATAELTEETVKDAAESTEECFAREERARSLNRAIEKLPKDMQDAVYLVYFEELSYKDAARVMKKTPKQVDNLIYRAKKELKSIITEEGGLLT